MISQSPRELLDPYHLLPSIRLDITDTTDVGYLIREKFSIIENDEAIGYGNLVSETIGESRFAHFDGIKVEERKRGRGIGLATYLLAIEMSHSRGYDFQTQNYELTTYSKKVWERLAEKAVAESIEAFTPSPRLNGRFVGKYRVPVER
jgi:GNAT superfamily N-acetyltransferase